MICEFCGREMLQNEVVVREQYGEIVNGEFMATDSPTLHHDDCGDDD